MANHLGNVLNVVTDRKLPFVYDSNTSGLVDYFTADVKSYSITIHSRWKCREGMLTLGITDMDFIGKESDPDMKGNGNSYDFGNRQYDLRLERWLSLDSLTEKL